MTGKIVSYFLFTRDSHFKIMIVPLKWRFLPDSILEVLCYSFTSLLWKRYDFVDSALDQGTSWRSKLVCGMLIFPVMFWFCEGVIFTL